MHIIFGIAFICLIIGAAVGVFIPITIALIIFAAVVIAIGLFFLVDRNRHSSGTSGGIGMLYFSSFLLAIVMGMVAMSMIMTFCLN